MRIFYTDGTSDWLSANDFTIFYDGTSTRVLYETDGSNNLLARYVYGTNGQLLAMVRGGVMYYYHYNGHGDVVALTDAAGTVVSTYDYDAFGNHIATTGSVVNPYRYAGYRWDAETGLYYLNARYYAPGVGMFISRDAFHGFEDDPARLNQYNYAHSNPVMFVDPSGYSSIPLNNGVTLGLSAFFFVPGVGQVSLLGIAAAAGGAWLISRYGLPWAIERYQISQISKSIPKSLKTSDNRVDLNKFNNKKPGSGPSTWIGPLGCPQNGVHFIVYPLLFLIVTIFYSTLT